MQTKIPTTMTAGYILGPDYCEIKPPNGISFAFKRNHPIPQPGGGYQDGAEWSDQFKRRMISILTENGFPIHEDNPHWLPTNEELDAIEAIDDELEDYNDSIRDFLIPTQWDGPDTGLPDTGLPDNGLGPIPVVSTQVDPMAKYQVGERKMTKYPRQP